MATQGLEIEILLDNQVGLWVQRLLAINQRFLAQVQSEAKIDSYTEFLDQREHILSQIAACPVEQRQGSQIPQLEEIQQLDHKIEVLIKEQHKQLQTERTQAHKSHTVLRAYQPEEPSDAHYIEEES